MKTTTLVLILFLTGLNLRAQTPLPAPLTPAQRQMQRLRAAATNNTAATPAGLPASAVSPAPLPGATAPGATAAAPAIPMTTPGVTAVSPDGATPPEQEVAGYSYNFPGVDVNQILDVYANLVGRTLLRAGLPPASITLKTQTPLTKSEAKEALEAVLALNGIAVIPIGTKFLKVLPPEQAAGSGGSLDSTDAAHLPELGTYVTHITQLKYIKPSVIAPLIQGFGKLQGNLFPIDDNGILVIRDYAENVKRMLEMIDKIDISVPAVYISEVIPIRYAKVDDIANALNSLGGSGSGASVSIGSSAANAPISGIQGNRTTGAGLGGMGTTQPGANPAGLRTGLGAQPNPNGTPSSASPFQQRLLNIINTAGGAAGGPQQPIQLFGQTKIIPNESSSSLLIYATRPDMDAITNIIAKLDVPLAQVLIEAVIVNYTLGNTFNFGVSAAQNPKNLSPDIPAVTAGGMNNGQSLPSFLNSISSATNLINSGNFASSLPSGLSYFGNIGPTWDVALTAAQSDSHASIIQRPRIQTSQAIPAQFFVGQAVPYITGSYSYNGVQNSYSQLSVGVELDVTPFINPEGAVTMQIQQHIDAIDNPNYNGTGQPSTVTRTLSTTITVRDKDTVMLGGFIEADKSHSQAGVPFLSDIPLLGNLFKKRDDSKTRKELIVLMRPTVLGTPELAAKNTRMETQRLPGVSATVAEDVEEQSKAVDAERKKELKHPKTMSGGFYNAPMPTNVPEEQVSPPVIIPMPRERLPQPQARDDGFFTPVATNAPISPANTNNAAPPP